MPTQLLTAGLLAGTPSSSTSAGRTMSGSINSTYEPIDRSATAAPGGGAGTAHCTTATASTPAAVHSVVASAPHFVLPFQKSAATSSGDSAEYPAKAYCVATSKIDCGMPRAIV